jgi:competence protein ComEC
METSIQHWKAAHPNLMISLYLLLGIYFGQSIHLSQFIDQGKYYIVIIILILISLLVLAYSKWQLCSIILIIWGYCLQSTSQHQTNLHFDFIDSFIEPIRLAIAKKIDLCIKESSSNAYSKALLMGSKAEMSPTLKEAYTSLGIIHIIAISGMHLEIIYQHLLRISYVLPFPKQDSKMKLLLLLFCIWVYTFVAQAGPSVVRASLFFSSYLIGRHYYLHKYTLNIIASGMLIIIIWQTKTIYHIGWQLSYAAVLGIHLLSPLFKKMIQIDNLILKLIWNNCVMSCAVQFTTLPLLLFYFHQASAWIILSNLIIVPLSNLLLHGLVLLICTPNYFSLAFYMGRLIEKYIIIINSIVLKLHIHSPRTFQFPKIQFNHIALYYVILLLLYLWLYQKQAKWLFIAILLTTSYILAKLFSI